MKTVKKLLAFLLAAQMALFAMPLTAFAEEPQDMNESSYSEEAAPGSDGAGIDEPEGDLTVPEEESAGAANTAGIGAMTDEELTGFIGSMSDDEFDSWFETLDETEQARVADLMGSDVDVMSLLPMEEVNCGDILIDYSKGGAPAEAVGDYINSFYIKDVIAAVTGNENYDGKILWAAGGTRYSISRLDGVATYSFDCTPHYYTYPDYGYARYLGEFYLILGATADDQFDNTDSKKYVCDLYLKTFDDYLIENLEVKIVPNQHSDDSIDFIDMNSVATYNKNIYTSYFSDYGYVHNISFDVLADSFDDLEDDTNMGTWYIFPPEGVIPDSDVSLYIGSTLTEGVPHQMEVIQNSNGYWGHIVSCIGGFQYGFGLDFTFSVTKSDGTKYEIPFYMWFHNVKNKVKLYTMPYSSTDGWSSFYSNPGDYSSYLGSGYIYESKDFSAADVRAFAKYNWFDGNEYVNAPDKVESAYWGYYESVEDAETAQAENIKDDLLKQDYSYTSVDLNKLKTQKAYLSDGTEVQVKQICVTVIDNDDVVYHAYGGYVGIAEHLPERLSNNTYLNMCGADIDGDGVKKSLNYYKVNEAYDSYYKNGYQTIFILDGQNPVTASEIYPSFYAWGKSNVYADGYIQTSKETAVDFESGNIIIYNVSAENGEDRGDYYVTYLTKQTGGAKLFVNATNNKDHYSKNNNPQREIFLNAGNAYQHNIFIANIGDNPLEGISVSLSDDTKGVKLDPYWTVINENTSKLNPFPDDFTKDPDNIAMISLVAEDPDKFSVISGTLTISTTNGGTVDIDLTGTAGVPKMIEGGLHDGVKYVPYSSMIMTNCMNGTDISFEPAGGNLPDWLSLKSNGELYGVPTETGEFTFTVKAVIPENESHAEYTFNQEYTITIEDNTDKNVEAVNKDDQGFELENRVIKYIYVYYSGFNGNTPNITDVDGIFEIFDPDDVDDVMADVPAGAAFIGGASKAVPLDEEDVPPENAVEEVVPLPEVPAAVPGDGSVANKNGPGNVFKSKGKLEDFVAFYIDGEPLDRDVDYTAVDGSTKITVRKQTFEHVSTTGRHTLAAEFRPSDGSYIMKRSAQNVHLEFVEVGNKKPNDNNNNNNNGNNVNEGTYVTPVLSNAGQPYIQGTDIKGWKAIAEELASCDEGKTVTINMNGTRELPKNIVENIKGRNIDLVLLMSGELSWKINGSSVKSAKSVNMGVSKKSKTNIPDNLLNSLGSNTDRTYLTLNYNGNFGFTADLTVSLGSKYNGLYANLFYYNTKEKSLDYISCGRISGGKAKLEFTHASEYVIAITDSPLGDYEDISANAGVTANAVPIDFSGSASGTSCPDFKLPEFKKFSVRKRRFRILRKRRSEDMIFVY